MLEFDTFNCYPRGILIGNIVSLNGGEPAVVTSMRIGVDSPRKKQRMFMAAFTAIATAQIDEISTADMLSFIGKEGNFRAAAKLPGNVQWTVTGAYEGLLLKDFVLSYANPQSDSPLSSVQVQGVLNCRGDDEERARFSTAIEQQKKGLIPGAKAQDVDDKRSSPHAITVFSNDLYVSMNEDEDDYRFDINFDDTRGDIWNPEGLVPYGKTQQQRGTYSAGANRFENIRAFVRYGFPGVK